MMKTLNVVYIPKIIQNATFILLTSFTLLTHAATSFYCPQRHGYINVGMTQDQVIAACGQPTAIRDNNSPVVQQIPVTQLIYSILNQGAMYYNPGITPVYNMWSLPSGSQGTSVEIDLVDNQVNAIKVNGSESNALSVCQGGKVQVGDNISAVYNACGAPSLINNTYVNKPVPANQKPQVWVYTIDQYQPSVTFTFINGILKSIN